MAKKTLSKFTEGQQTQNPFFGESGTSPTLVAQDYIQNGLELQWCESICASRFLLKIIDGNIYDYCDPSSARQFIRDLYYAGILYIIDHDPYEVFGRCRLADIIRNHFFNFIHEGWGNIITEEYERFAELPDYGSYSTSVCDVFRNDLCNFEIFVKRVLEIDFDFSDNCEFYKFILSYNNFLLESYFNSIPDLTLSIFRERFLLCREKFLVLSKKERQS